jgi:TolB-like protein/Tfp pilus assembly protein PilF
MRLLAELKRRNVIRMAGLYLVGAWLIVQVAGTLLPVFEAPSWVMKTLVGLLAVGFVPALVFSWVFELTPEGIKRDAEVRPGESISPQTARRLDRTITAVLVLALGYFGFDKFVLAPRREVALVARTQQATKVEAAAQSTRTGGDKSIAVLPFANLSDDKANAFFADGMQDEILTKLSKIGALRVISRTSTQRYASAPENLAEIARQLGVANILEGTVQKAGDSVHINVQLIRAAGDEHLWAESYNRKLDDIFGVEGEVAQAVADALKAKLTGAEVARLAVKPTQNPAAYDAYLRGLALADRTSSWAENATQAIASFELAVSLDPELAPAWARLSFTHSQLYFGWEPSSAHRDAARHASEVAARLAPDSAETLLAQGFYRYRVERDYASARGIFERLRSELPSGAEPIAELASIARDQGRWIESQQLFAEAFALDPRNQRLVISALDTAVAMRDFAVAQGLIERAFAIAPADATATRLQAELLHMRGEVEQAQRVIDQAQIPAGDIVFLYLTTSNAILLHRHGPALAAIDTELARADRRRSDDGYLQFLRAELQRHAGDGSAAASSYRDARSILSSQMSTAPANYWLPCTLAQVEAGLGNEAEALTQARRAVALLPAAENAYVGPYFEEILARVQARFGHKDEAIAALQRLVAIPYGGGGWPVTHATLRLDPDWDALRDDPRFRALLQEPPVAKAGQ